MKCLKMSYMKSEYYNLLEIILHKIYIIICWIEHVCVVKVKALHIVHIFSNISSNSEASASESWINISSVLNVMWLVS